VKRVLIGWILLEYVSWIAYALLVYGTGSVIRSGDAIVLFPYCINGCVRPASLTDDVNRVLVYSCGE
jgi:hypothetical protein